MSAATVTVTRVSDLIEEVARGAVLMGASDGVAVRAAIKKLEQVSGAPLTKPYAVIARRVYQEYVTMFRAGLIPVATKERARA